jgi:hypothetical protein
MNIVVVKHSGSGHYLKYENPDKALSKGEPEFSWTDTLEEAWELLLPTPKTSGVVDFTAPLFRNLSRGGVEFSLERVPSQERLSLQ